MWSSIVEMWLVRKVPEDLIWKRGKEYLCVSGPRVNADSWFRWKQLRFVDGKKIQTIGIDPILKFQTQCDIALWKCGSLKKFQKIRFGRDRRIIHAVPVQEWMLIVDFVENISSLLIGREIQTIAIDPILKFHTLLDIALWKCGFWKKFQKIRFGRDGRSIYAFPVRG